MLAVNDEFQGASRIGCVRIRVYVNTHTHSCRHLQGASLAVNGLLSLKPTLVSFYQQASTQRAARSVRSGDVL